MATQPSTRKMKEKKRYIKSLQKFWAALKYAIIPGYLTFIFSLLVNNVVQMYRGSFYPELSVGLALRRPVALSTWGLCFFLAVSASALAAQYFWRLFIYLLFHIQKVKEYQLQFHVVVQKSTELQGNKKSIKEECSPWFYLSIIKDYLSALWQPFMKLMYNNGFYPYSWHH